jgi:3-dehydrosphinganine reductase
VEWYKGKKVVITGGSSGIGKAAACWCAKWGAHICIIGRDAARLDAAVREIEACAPSPEPEVLAISADVSDRPALKAAASDIVKRLGGIDVLINCAGITFPAYVNETPDRIWDDMMAVDYMGTVNAVRSFLPVFMQQKHGAIGNVASVLGYMGVFGYAAYGAAKYAVVGFSECLRQDLLPYNINVTVAYPPDTDTPQWHEENKIKPPETRALAGTIKVMRPEDVSLSFLKGIAKGRFTIVPGAMNKLTYFLSRHLPAVVWMIVSGDLRKYWRKHPS